MDRKDLIEDGRVKIEVGKDVSRRSLMKQIGALGAIGGLAGCQALLGDGDDGDGNGDAQSPDGGGGGGSGSPAEVATLERHSAAAPPGWDAAKTESGAGDTPHRAVLTLQSIDNPFFVPMIVGFQDALNVLGWTGEVTGPGGQNAGDVARHVSVIEQTIEDLDAGDVIVSTVLNRTSYNDAIQQALDNDILFMDALNSPAIDPPDGQGWTNEWMMENFTYRDQGVIIPFIGKPEAASGATVAQEMYSRLQERFPDQDEYTVLISNELPGNAAVTRRVAASSSNSGTAQRYLETRSDPSVSLYNDEIINPPANVADARAEIVNTIQGEDVDGVLSSTYWGPVGAAQAIEDGELDGPMVTCGYDLTPPIPSSISNGNLDFTVDQDPYSTAYISVMMSWRFLERGIPMQNHKFGLAVWDESNVEFLLERQSWSDLMDWQNNNYDL